MMPAIAINCAVNRGDLVTLFVRHDYPKHVRLRFLNGGRVSRYREGGDGAYLMDALYDTGVLGSALAVPPPGRRQILRDVAVRPNLNGFVWLEMTEDQHADSRTVGVLLCPDARQRLAAWLRDVPQAIRNAELPACEAEAKAGAVERVRNALADLDVALAEWRGLGAAREPRTEGLIP
jgi:hypothetical protein